MTDNERIPDADLVAQVAAHDQELAKLIEARLRRLRLGRVVTVSPGAIATNGGGTWSAGPAITGEAGKQGDC